MRRRAVIVIEARGPSKSTCRQGFLGSSSSSSSGCRRWGRGWGSSVWHVHTTQPTPHKHQRSQARVIRSNGTYAGAGAGVGSGMEPSKPPNMRVNRDRTPLSGDVATGLVAAGGVGCDGVCVGCSGGKVTPATVEGNASEQATHAHTATQPHSHTHSHTKIRRRMSMGSQRLDASSGTYPIPTRLEGA